MAPLASTKSDDNKPPLEISSYLIFINGELKATVGYHERTKCLVEGLNTRKFHRIAVRTNSNRGQSRDPECTLTFGRGSSLAPQALKACSVSASTANLGWCPSNSNCHHIVYVNNVEHCVLEPGVYRYTLQGLLPSTTYRVSIKAKDLSGSTAITGRATPTSTLDLSGKRVRSSSADVNIAQIVFKTMPGGLPDTPQGVQIENGPREGTVLVSWLPVGMTSTGTSNGALVTGYALYADGNRKIAEMPSPTGKFYPLLNNGPQRLEKNLFKEISAEPSSKNLYRKK